MILLFCEFSILSLKTDVNVHTVRNKQNKLNFCWRLESHCQKWKDPYADPQSSARIEGSGSGFVSKSGTLVRTTLDFKERKTMVFCI
jgi:hypothetical protein